MKKRSLILRVCPKCKKEKYIRKDGVGIYCRRCRAMINNKSNPSRHKDLKGQRFGKLIVQEIDHINKSYFWRCLCDCGNEKVIHGNRLRSGKTKSCGCIVKVKEGLSTSPEYRSWHAMIQRCYNPNNIGYKNYGGRGIKVCDSWKESFFNFLHDMGKRPKNKTIDRINNDENYEKNNCRWSLPSEQATNRRKVNAKT